MLETLGAFVPRTLDGLFSILTAPLELLDKLLSPLGDLSCPSFRDLTLEGENLHDKLLDKYPGAGKAGFAF